jgi:hypothetical protein
MSIDNSIRRIPSLMGVHPAKCADVGIFALGNSAADLIALSYVKKRTASRSEYFVVVCGRAIRVLTAAEGLIRAGVDAGKIVCVIEEAADQLQGCGAMAVRAVS